MHLRIFFFSFFLFFPYFWFWIHISQMDIIMTTKHDMHNIFFCLFSMDITEEIYNWDSNKTSTIHLNPYFFSMIFFRQMHHCFSFIKILYSQKTNKHKKQTKKTNTYIFSFSCNSWGRGQQPSSKRWNICQNTLWSWQKILQCPHFLLLHTALIHYSSAWHEFLHTDNPKSLYFITTTWKRKYIYIFLAIMKLIQ